jgi:inorganic triphosphatase YgiF
VKARFQAGLFQRPSYEIFVDDTLLHTEKGMLGGF